mgnify:CR=1 FL=1
MAYRNNNYNNGNNYNNRGYRNNNYNGGNRGYNNRNNYQNNQPAPKRSGAKYSVISKGDFKGFLIVNAWNKSRSKGMITAKVAPYKDSQEYTAKTSGKTYITMIAEVFYRDTGQKMIVPCSMNKQTRVIVLSDLGMVITPNGSGQTSVGVKVTGYFGKFSR